MGEDIYKFLSDEVDRQGKKIEEGFFKIESKLDKVTSTYTPNYQNLFDHYCHSIDKVNVIIKNLREEMVRLTDNQKGLTQN